MLEAQERRQQGRQRQQTRPREQLPALRQQGLVVVLQQWRQRGLQPHRLGAARPLHARWRGQPRRGPPALQRACQQLRAGALRAPRKRLLWRTKLGCQVQRPLLLALLPALKGWHQGRQGMGNKQGARARHLGGAGKGAQQLQQAFQGGVGLHVGWCSCQWQRRRQHRQPCVARVLQVRGVHGRSREVVPLHSCVCVCVCVCVCKHLCSVWGVHASKPWAKHSKAERQMCIYVVWIVAALGQGASCYLGMHSKDAYF